MTRFSFETELRGPLAVVELHGELDMLATAALEPELERLADEPGKNTYTVTGNLTLHGVTKPVTLSALAKTAIHPLTKKTIAGFKITGKINRKDFGVAEQTPAAMLGEEVNILANAEFIRN